ncbi:hypothetical protein RD055328_12670 [Companilactobacillus sp. RD055328]|uniref:hypothetical protein n=1 Tax=Companilactobacillus sp. RD055328 TaxID=2916634 RepID=UPI001FC86C30|nr:hypothetical protein [Companilactobacillus sp. RD055328]GKQ43344.1 hypothetical protein RD055328_12670 [Companilactobacillus sp. RD055328]
MKKNKIITSVLISASLLGTTIPSSVALASVNQNDLPAMTTKANNQAVNSLDKFVGVKNNQYILEIPSDYRVSSDTLKQAKNLITDANKRIRENNLILNEKTKTADKIINVQSFGKNGISIHWNYVRIYLNRNVVRAAANGAGNAVGAAIGAALAANGLSAMFATAVGAFIGSALGSWASSKIKNGAYFDVNYYFGINNWGWQ